jgi:hypothetical protein
MRIGACLLGMMLAVGSAGAQGARGCNVGAGDEAKVAETLRTFYVAATNDDLALFHTVAAADFYAFDGGRRYDGDALMGMVKTAHAAGRKLVWTVNDPKVVMDCRTALITYVNHGSATDTTGTKEVTWLESAWLEKGAGGWKMRFFQSQRAAEAGK